jgi:hypothetical protein
MANHYTEEDEQQFKTPWQMEAEQSAVDQPPPTASSILAAKPATESVIEGLPYGFFDDKIINSKVKKMKISINEFNL